MGLAPKKEEMTSRYVISLKIQHLSTEELIDIANEILKLAKSKI